MMGMDLPKAERLSSRVVCVRGLNPGFFTGPGTNTYIVGTGSQRVLIDAGDAGVGAYISLLQRTLRDECGGACISRILITHSHPDHIGGARAVADACGVPPPSRVAFLKARWPGNDAGLPIETVEDGAVVRVDATTTLRAHFTPGHAPDHVCWSLEEERVLFSGDNILGAGTVIVPAQGGSMRLYLESLRRLSAQPWNAIYPGHGPPIRGAAAVATVHEYIAHREQREAQIVSHLRPQNAKSAAELVGLMYRDRVLSFELRQAATETVYNHLLFLREKGMAEAVGTSHGRGHVGISAGWVRAG